MLLEEFGVQYLVLRHVDMCTGGTGDLTTNFPINEQFIIPLFVTVEVLWLRWERRSSTCQSFGGLIPDASSLYVEASLCKIPNAKLSTEWM